jgi:hypothetical protein
MSHGAAQPTVDTGIFLVRTFAGGPLPRRYLSQRGRDVCQQRKGARAFGLMLPRVRAQEGRTRTHLPVERTARGECEAAQQRGGPLGPRTRELA